MPLAKPHLGESRKDFIARCYGDHPTRSEFNEDNNQIGGYCFTAWKEHVKKERAKGAITIYAGNNEYVETPEGPEKKVLQVAGDDSDPINDSGSNPPVSDNPAPPAAPFPAPVAPSVPSDDTKTPGDNSTDDPFNTEYVGAKQVKPAPLPNPEGGALDPNPDNDTLIPKPHVPENGGADSLDDHSAKPELKDLPVFMGKHLNLRVDKNTGLAKWPLSWDEIDRGFKPTNRVPDPNAEPKHKDQQDAEHVAKTEKPYVI